MWSYKVPFLQVVCCDLKWHFILTYNDTKIRRKSQIFKNASNWTSNPISKIYKKSIDKISLKIEIRLLKICTTIPCLEARAEMNFFTDFKLNLFIPSGILCSDTSYCLKSVKNFQILLISYTVSNKSNNNNNCPTTSCCISHNNKEVYPPPPNQTLSKSAQ